MANINNTNARPPRRWRKPFSCFLSLCALVIFSIYATIINNINVQNISTNSSLQQEIENLNMEISRLKNEINLMEGAANNETHVDEKKNIDVSVAVGDKHETRNVASRRLSDVCRPLSPTLPQAGTTWRENLGLILEAAQAVHDYHDDVKQFFALLVDMITPEMLMRSVKTLPKLEDLRRVVGIVQKRYLHTVASGNDETDPPPPKLKILVFGGSVTMGVLCLVNPLGIPKSMQRKGCAWPSRVQKMLNRLLGFDAVEIVNEAVGGTNSELALFRWEYDLMPDEMKYPDVIINSYSSNDMHVLSMLDAEAKNVTLEEALFDMTQNFIRGVEERKGCDDDDGRRPLLVYLDDYLGNEQTSVMETMAAKRSIEYLAEYYGIMSISYADAVRHMVYADTRDTWLSPVWYPDGTFTRQIHHNMGSHVSIALVVLFNVLNAVTLFCSEEAFRNTSEKQEVVLPLSDEVEGAFQTFTYRLGEGRLPPVNFTSATTKVTRGPPSSLPRGILPKLTKELNLMNVTSLWRSSSEEHVAKCNAVDGSGSSVSSSLRSSCFFSWISGTKGIKDEQLLMDKLKPYVVENNGWDAAADGKLGWVASSADSKSFTIEFKNLEQPVEVINLLYMKSYGDKWADSRVRVDVSTSSEGETTTTTTTLVELEGFHYSKTSVTYQEKLELDAASIGKVGGTLKLSVELIGGTTFKFTGMAFCGAL